MEEIIVTIEANGTFSYKVNGVKGKGCKKLTKAIDDLGKVTETKNTNEYEQLGSGQACSIDQKQS